MEGLLVLPKRSPERPLYVSPSPISDTYNLSWGDAQDSPRSERLEREGVFYHRFIIMGRTRPAHNDRVAERTAF